MAGRGGAPDASRKICERVSPAMHSPATGAAGGNLPRTVPMAAASARHQSSASISLQPGRGSLAASGRTVAATTRPRSVTAPARSEPAPRSTARMMSLTLNPAPETSRHRYHVAETREIASPLRGDAVLLQIVAELVVTEAEALGGAALVEAAGREGLAQQRRLVAADAGRRGPRISRDLRGRRCPGRAGRRLPAGGGRRRG